METLRHAHVDVLKVDVEGAEFDVVDAWEAYYGDRGPPACQLLFEWHERFYPDGGQTSGDKSRWRADARFARARRLRSRAWGSKRWTATGQSACTGTATAARRWRTSRLSETYS